jgi:nicotinate-nucleotide adenylyltransferase
MRFGVFGGSFDPPHAAHAAAAKTSRERLALDRMIWVPTFAPPHKDSPSTPFPHRLGMVRALIADDAGDDASDIESGLPRPSFTLNTLRALKALYGSGHSWHLLLGADAWALFPKWHQPQAVLDEAELIVVPRQGLPLTGLPKTATVLEGADWPEASRRFREQCRQDPGNALKQLPETVAEYIRAHGLYGLAREKASP